MPWWGDPWPSDALRSDVCSDDALRIAVPVGHACINCGEVIKAGDRGVSMGSIDASGKPNPEPVHAHIECQMRSVMGCSAKLRGEPCDHSGSYRADAIRVWLMVAGYA